MTRGEALATHLKMVCEPDSIGLSRAPGIYTGVMNNTERITWLIQHLLRS